MNRLLYRIITPFLFSITILHGQPIQVKKLFHHKGRPQGSIEIANIVFYLDHDPKITATTVQNGSKVERVFFLAETEIAAKEAIAAVEQINRTEGMPYAVKIVQTPYPQKGLRITLAYDDSLVGITHSHFDSISLHKGVVFRLYNKDVIKKINSATTPIIQTASHTPRVIIDCGHGGNDPGAIGCNSIMEKKLSLQVGLQVASLLRAKKIDVYLTRDTDRTVLLDERTSFANKYNGDLFVSIHANAALNRAVSGLETYCMSNNLFTEDSPENIIKKQLDQKHAASDTLARTVHRSILATVHPYCVNDRSVRHAVSQVLLGSTMPAILVEIGYVTHEKEAELLVQAQYQAMIAHGIVQGISSYLYRS